MNDKGVFTVKRCYKVLQKECTDDYTRLWKQIWSLKLPRKVTHLLWRLCKDCLPTNATLFRRYVEIEVTCPQCHSAAETGVHVMFLCDFARTVWRAEELDTLVSCVENENPKIVLECMFDQGSKEQCLEVSMLCWSLWHRRNRWFGNVRMGLFLV